MRRQDREVTDLEDVLGIVGRAQVLRLGMMAGDYPYVVPLHYGFEWLPADGAGEGEGAAGVGSSAGAGAGAASEGRGGCLVFYLHCAHEGRKLDLIRANPHVCVELDCDVQMVSGGDVPCRYGSAYASVIGTGVACVVEDAAEKIHGLQLLMRNQIGRDFDFDQQMAASVEVVKVVVSDFSAKRRLVG